MRTLFEAVADAQLNYIRAERVSPYTGDVKEISASVSSICACRGKCGSHSGPCTMQAGSSVTKPIMCKACSTAMSAGGPGSGRKATMSIAQKHGYKTTSQHGRVNLRPTTMSKWPDKPVASLKEEKRLTVHDDGSWKHSSGTSGSNAHELSKHLGGIVAASKTKSHVTDGPMTPLKDKKPKKEGDKTVQAPDDLARDKGKAPDKNGKIIAQKKK